MSRLQTHLTLLLVICLAPSGFAQDAATSPTASAKTASSETANHFAWESSDGKVTLVDGDQLVLAYVLKSGSKPIIYPIIGPDGRRMTRDYPMQAAAKGGTADHPHHRSLWLTHGEVNGVDFWMEGAKGGQIVHRSISKQEVAPESATLATESDWITPAGEALLNENRVMIVRGESSSRMIDFQFTLTAAAPKVHFGDTKEGSFGLRVPDTMAVDKKAGGVITNEHGEKNDAAWGKRSRWVDYSGPVNGKTVGITVFDHPSSLAHPCRWHVRTYGLFAANPFGQYHFIGGRPTAGVTLEKGESLKLRYLVLLHEGNADVDQIEAVWKQFSMPQ